MNYVYIRSEHGLWTVGFYAPDGKWQSESDHTSTEDAANRVSFLSGASRDQTIAELKDVLMDAWAIIANAPEESWRMLSQEEQRAIMVRWRDRFHAVLESTHKKAGE